MPSKAKTAKSARKSDQKPRRVVGELVPYDGPNGGALWRGPSPNAILAGRPPSKVREQLLGYLEEVAPVAREIVQGKPMQTLSVPIRLVAPYLVCANCGEHQLKPFNSEAAAVEITVEASSSPSDRVRGLDFLAKYAIGPAGGVSAESVKARVRQTVVIAQGLLSPELFAEFLQQIAPVWQGEGK